MLSKYQVRLIVCSIYVILSVLYYCNSNQLISLKLGVRYDWDYQWEELLVFWC